ncbi:MAG TPA: hypothetical protein PLX85_00230 [Dehalococcoidia bacterium]|nr:hypothetical protein [Dehalococcoidia bacterium]
MAYVAYTARRSLAPGHIENFSYTLPLRFTRADRRTDANVHPKRSLSGKTETLFHGLVVTWDVGVAPVAQPLVDILREFLDSTLDGQTFQFNPFSDVESDEISVIREDDGYPDRRFLQTGLGHRFDRFAFDFRLREV